jgi:hypothetical protein
VIAINECLGGFDALRRVACHVEHLDHLLGEAGLSADHGGAVVFVDVYADGKVESYDIPRNVKLRDGRVYCKVKIARESGPQAIRDTLWEVVSEAVALLPGKFSDVQIKKLEVLGNEFLQSHRARSPKWFRVLWIGLTFGGLGGFLDAATKLFDRKR